MHTARWIPRALAALTSAALLLGGASAVATAAPRGTTARATSATSAAAATPAAPAAPATSWTIQALPQRPLVSHDLLAVSCPTATFCMAVGASLTPHGPSAGRTRPLVETFDGRGWTLRYPIRPAASTQTSLAGVSCPTARDCTVVGATGDSNRASAPLAETWNATTQRWRVEAAVNPVAGALDGFFSVSCPTTAYCMAVGQRGGARSPALREDWTSGGVGWRIAPGPWPGRGSVLASVSCRSRLQCAAVGTETTVPATSTSVAQTHELLEAWNGAKWSLAAVATPSQTVLNGVACPSPTWCMAVGEGPGGSFGLSELNGHWGVPHATPGRFTPQGVDCAGPTECVAVGVTTSGRNVNPAIEYWNGSSWAVQSVPSPGALEDLLAAVSCPTATRCLAAGFTFNGSVSSPVQRVFAELGTIRP